MYNQTHAQAQHGMLNSGAAHRGYMGIGLNKPPFGHGQHQQHHVQQQQHQQHQEHGAHGNYGHHQHNLSGGGTMASTTPHFGQAHLQNGGTSNNLQNAINNAPSEHWATQLRLAQETREMNQAHPHARTHPAVNKSVLSNGVNGAAKDTGAKEEHRSRPTTVPEPSNEIWTALDCGVQNLKTLSPALFQYTFLTKLYLNSNRLTMLPAAIGRLRSLTELDISINQIRELPAEIGMLVGMKELRAFDNLIADLPVELGSLYNLEMLGIEGNPLDEGLKSKVMHEGTPALIEYLRENAQPPEPPMDRPWEEVIAEDKEEVFKVMSWNTLCQRFCTPQQYGFSPSAALDWDHRKELILDEIRGRDPDIFCMQEVDGESYNEYFRPNLAANDYKASYYAKGRARQLPESGGSRTVDGCGTFWKNSKYILLDKSHFDFQNVAINRADMKGDGAADTFNRLMNRDHIALVVFLENRQTGTRMIVANSHIFWDPQYVDVKVMQVAILLEQLTKLADRWSKFPPCTDKKPFSFANGDSLDGGGSSSSSRAPAAAEAKMAPSVHYDEGGEIPMLICGDFNSVPSSGIYNLFTQGSMPASHPDIAGRMYGNFTRDGITHPFQLKSAYSHVNELDFTNYTSGYKGVIDYIWYSNNSMGVKGLLGNIDKHYLTRVPGFPNWHFPSDHIALLSEFFIKPRKEKKVQEADFGPARM